MWSWETHILAYFTSFYWSNVARHLWSNLQTYKKYFWEKEFECTKCKATFKIFFQHFWLLYAFLVRMTACTLHMKSFSGINNLNGLNDLNSLNNLSDFNDLNSLISSKTLYFKVKMYIFDGLLNFITWKRPLKVKILRKTMNLWCFPNWSIDGAQHWLNKNWLGRQKCGFLRNT